MDHDQLFKYVFGTPRHAADHLRTFLPTAVTDALALDELEVVPGTFVDETLRENRVDLLFSVPVRGTDTQVFVHVLLEHQRTIAPMMPFRLLRYMLRIWEEWLKSNPAARKIPPIIPKVLYQADGAWTGPRRFSDLIAEPARLGEHWQTYIPDFAFYLIELGLADDDNLGPPTHATVLRFMQVTQQVTREVTQQVFRESQRNLLERLLERRFGPLPLEMKPRLDSLHESELLLRFDMALTATSLNEVFKDDS